jgi:hypothetical protein
MVEYGQGVGQATGVAGGGGGGGGSTDIGASAAAFVRDTADTIAALPPEALVAIAIAIFLGLIVLRRAF